MRIPSKPNRRGARSLLVQRLCGATGALLLCLSVGLSEARAECPKAYTTAELGNDIGALTVALRELDEGTFKEAGARVESNLMCVAEPIPTPVFASAYRYIGALHFLIADEEVARRYFRSSLELDPTFDWDINDLEQGHPMRVAFNQERAVATTDPTPIDGMVLSIPAGSKLLLDGRELTEPTATLDRPHLLQVVSTTDNSVRQSQFIEGNALPENLLRDASLAVVAEDAAAAEDTSGRRKRKKDATEVAYGDYDVVQVQRVRPAAKTPLMIAGGAVVLGGGVLYGMSYTSRAQFDAATTTDELNNFKALTNTLVVASGVAVATGLGIEVVGIRLSTSPGLVVGGHF